MKKQNAKPAVVAAKPALTVADYIAAQNPALLTISPAIASFPVGIAKPVAGATFKFSEYKTKIAALDKSKVSREANKVREQFINLLGLPACSTKTGSYKGSEKANMNLLENIIEMRNRYEIICNVTGNYFSILEKMDRNLRNSDRASLFAALERKANKAKTVNGNDPDTDD